MVARTQITLDPESHRRAKARAAELGISLAEYFRRLADRDLAQPERAVDVSRAFDLGDSRGADVSQAKDEYIGEAIAVARGKRARPRGRKRSR